MTKPLMLEGEWSCIEQEGGHAYPGCLVDRVDIGDQISEWLGLRDRDWDSGKRIRITVELIDSTRA